MFFYYVKYQSKVFCIILVSVTHAMCLAYLIILDLIMSTACEVYNRQSAMEVKKNLDHSVDILRI